MDAAFIGNIHWIPFYLTGRMAGPVKRKPIVGETVGAVYFISSSKMFPASSIFISISTSVTSFSKSIS